jgi:hypothetical protein
MADTVPTSVIPQRYLDALGDADPIESQRKAPKRIKKLLKGLSEKFLARRPTDDQWSIKEIVAHLADGEIILGSRVRFVAAQDRPPLPGYDQDLFVAHLGIDKVKTKHLLQAFAAARAVNVALLNRLPDGAFARIGMHAERGVESIETMVRMNAGHDHVHEAQIVAARDALRAAKRRRKKAAAKAASAKRTKRAKRTGRSAKKARKTELVAAGATSS